MLKKKWQLLKMAAHQKCASLQVDWLIGLRWDTFKQGKLVSAGQVITRRENLQSKANRDTERELVPKRKQEVWWISET